MKRILLCTVICFIGFLYGQPGKSCEMDSTGIGVNRITSEFILNFPSRSFNSFLSWMPGVSSQDGKIHFWAGTAPQVGYEVNGFGVNDPISGNMGIELIPEAINYVDVTPGWIPADLSESGSGLVKVNLKKGTEHPHFTLNYQTDQFGKKGNKLLGTTIFGDRIMTATYSGPLYLHNLRLFAALEKNVEGDTRKAFSEGFEYHNLPITGGYIVGNYKVGDTISTWSYPDGITPRNHSSHWNLNSRLTYEWEGLMFDLTTFFREGNRYRDDNPAISFLNPREQYLYSNQRVANFQISKQIRHNTRVRAGYQYYHTFSETRDSYMGDNWRLWYDSAAVSGTSGLNNLFIDEDSPYSHPEVNYFSLNGPGYSPPYHKEELNAHYFFADFGHKWDDAELKIGFSRRQSKFYRYQILPGIISSANDLGLNLFDGSPTQENVGLWRIYTSEILGYDYAGDKKNPVNKAADPSYTKVFLSTDWDKKGFHYNAGVIYEHLDLNSWKFKDPLRLEFILPNYLFARENQKFQSFDYFSPRFSVTSLLNKNVLLNLSGGRFISQPELGSLFLDYDHDALDGVIFGYNFIPYNIKPIITDLLQLGAEKKYGPIGSISAAIFIKKNRNLATYDSLEIGYNGSASGGSPLYIRTSEGKNTVFGINTAFNFRLNSCFRLRGNYNFVHTSGTPDEDYTQIFFLVNSINSSSDNARVSYEQKHRINLLATFSGGKNSENIITRNLELTGILRMNSGHPYTAIEDAYYGGSHGPDGTIPLKSPEFIHRIGRPGEFTTPWQTYFDLYLGKGFNVFESTKVIWYMRIQNLFNIKNTINVYPQTGSATADGTNSFSIFQEVTNYRSMYNKMNFQNGLSYYQYLHKELYSHPRQIMIGLKVEI